jgi:hypothetical protein
MVILEKICVHESHEKRDMNLRMSRAKKFPCGRVLLILPVRAFRVFGGLTEAFL